MPIGIFSFAQKPESQKIEKKRRKTKKTRENLGFSSWHLFCQDALEATSGFGPENNGFADRGLTTWLCRLKTNAPVEWERTGADYGARTRHLHLGKVALYQMS